MWDKESQGIWHLNCSVISPLITESAPNNFMALTWFSSLHATALHHCRSVSENLARNHLEISSSNARFPKNGLTSCYLENQTTNPAKFCKKLYMCNEFWQEAKILREDGWVELTESCWEPRGVSNSRFSRSATPQGGILSPIGSSLCVRREKSSKGSSFILESSRATYESKILLYNNESWSVPLPSIACDSPANQ